MSLLLPDSGLVFWMLLSFGVVFFVVARYGFPVILRMVDQRKAYIDESLRAAKQANEQLAQIKESTKALTEEAERERNRILKEAADERASIVAEARKQAAVAARKELEIVREQIRREKEEAIRDIRSQVAVLSVDIAEKVIRKELSSEREQLEMIDRMVDEVLHRN